MDGKPSGDAERIGETFRSGSITAVGVIAGFSLTFLTAWSASPIPWRSVDALAVIPLVVGVGLELWSLAKLLDPDSLVLVRYRRAVRIFLAGLVLVAIGVAAALAIDIAPLSQGF